VETIAQICSRLAWNAPALVREAGIGIDTARKLLAGKGASPRIRRMVTDAINKRLKTPLLPGDIIWEWKETDSPPSDSDN
jgi:hypothetical protein